MCGVSWALCTHYFKFICRAMNVIAMAFEVNMLAAVQSSQLRIAIRESCIHICDGILVVNGFLRIDHDAAVMQLFFLTSQLEHIRNLNYHFCNLRRSRCSGEVTRITVLYIFSLILWAM